VIPSSGISTRADTQVAEERVTEVLDGVLSRAEFNDEPGVVARILEDFVEWLSEMFGGSGPDVDPSTIEAWAQGVWISLTVVAGALLLWFWIKVLRSRGRRLAQARSALTEEVAARVAELRAEAREAQAVGDLTRALRLYFFALVVGLGERGELDYNDAWTNRELLERGEPGERVVTLLRPLVGELDEHSFGRRPTGPAEVRRFAILCEELLGGEFQSDLEGGVAS